MSRIRMVHTLALLGILIVTGGCANSATAPEAATAEAGLNHANNPTQNGQGNNNKPVEGDDGEVTIESGFIVGG